MNINTMVVYRQVPGIDLNDYLTSERKPMQISYKWHRMSKTWRPSHKSQHLLNNSEHVAIFFEILDNGNYNSLVYW